MEYINIFIKSIFVDNMIFAFFLGTVTSILTADGHQHTVRLMKQSDIYGQ